MREGFIYLHRKLLDNPVFDNPHLLKVWIWCLLKASHAKHDVLIGRQNVTLEPGQFIFGRIKAAEALNMKPSTVRDYMSYFERYQMIINKSNNKYSLVTITNWASYQTYSKNSDSKPTANQQLPDTYNNGNTGDTANTGSKNENENAPLPDGKAGMFFLERREPYDPTINNAITYYYKNYYRQCHREHPNLKPEQFQRVHDNLKAFMDGCSNLDEEGWETEIDYHFSRNLETDWNIQHFATEGILTNAYYKTGY